MERVNPAHRRGWYPTLLDDAELPDCARTKRSFENQSAIEVGSGGGGGGSCCHGYGLRQHAEQTTVVPSPSCLTAVNFGKQFDYGCVHGLGVVSRGPYGTISATVVDPGGSSTMPFRRSADQSASNCRESIVTSLQPSGFHIVGNSRHQQASTQLLNQQPSAGGVGAETQNVGNCGRPFNV
jgi:hypothetical protein